MTVKAYKDPAMNKKLDTKESDIQYQIEDDVPKFYKSQKMNADLQKAKDTLGESYILHSKYDSSKNPKHLKKSVDY